MAMSVNPPFLCSLKSHNNWMDCYHISVKTSTLFWVKPADLDNSLFFPLDYNGSFSDHVLPTALSGWFHITSNGLSRVCSWEAGVAVLTAEQWGKQQIHLTSKWILESHNQLLWWQACSMSEKDQWKYLKSHLTGLASSRFRGIRSKHFWSLHCSPTSGLT